MCPAAVQCDPGTGDKALYGGRDEYLGATRHTLNPRGLMNGQPGHVIATCLDLARVQPGTYLDPEL